MKIKQINKFTRVKYSKDYLGWSYKLQRLFSFLGFKYWWTTAESWSQPTYEETLKYLMKSERSLHPQPKENPWK